MNDDSSNELFRASDIGAGFGLLTRLPLPLNHQQAAARGAAAVWSYPLVGAVLGAIGATGALLAGWLGAPVGIAAAFALALLVLMTGAMHEDGLADCADGLGGGHSRERRLEIMRDSRIGAFGAAALCLGLIARWSGVEALAESGTLFAPLVAIGAVSRLPMVLALLLMPTARRDGLSAGVGMPPAAAVLAAAVLALAIAFLMVGWAAFGLLFWALVAPLPLFWLAGRLIGGQTGDVLGASQQLAEIAALASLA